MTTHKPQTARNYGNPREGGDPGAMGRTLNESMCQAWWRMQDCRRWAKKAQRTDTALRPTDYDDMAYDAQRELLALCEIRKAGRDTALKA